MAKLSTKPMSTEYLVFLRPLDETQDVIISERGEKKIVGLKKSAFRKARVKEVANNGRQEGKIGSE